MRRSLRWLFWVVSGLLLVAGAAVGALLLAFPRVGEAPDIVVEVTPERRARGAYLAEHVAVCIDCHSERDAARFSAPPKPGTLGKGGERFGRELGLPGQLVAPNITPHALGGWSDGELVRAITSGVTPDGRALFPLMGYPAYATLCKSDLEALVAYLRALPSIESEPAKSELDFPVNLIVRTLPKAAEAPAHCPDPTNTVEQGRYLVRVAGCADCHTPREGSELVTALMFGGGVTMPAPGGGSVLTKNITPDETGIGGWSREAFIRRFAMYRDPANLGAVGADDPRTPMPWSLFAGMTDEDLGAIYDYLRTVPPVRSAAAHVAAR